MLESKHYFCLCHIYFFFNINNTEKKTIFTCYRRQNKYLFFLEFQSKFKTV